MKIIKGIALLLVVTACGMVSKESSVEKVRKAKSFESITVGERSGLVGQSSLARLLDDGRYLVVNPKGNWDTIGAVEPAELEKAVLMLEKVKNLELKSLGDGDEKSVEYKVEANLKPEGYVYYLWPKGREKVPQDLQDLFHFIKKIDPRLE